MGRLLQVRVSVSTYRPEDVEKAWPNLCALAWPTLAPDEELTGRGVLELVGTLENKIRFGVDDQALKDSLSPGMQSAVDLKTRLEQHLADWQPSEANTLTTELESTLDELNRMVPKPDFKR